MKNADKEFFLFIVDPLSGIQISRNLKLKNAYNLFARSKGMYFDNYDKVWVVFEGKGE